MRVAARAPGASARRTPTTDHVVFEGTAWEAIDRIAARVGAA